MSLSLPLRRVAVLVLGVLAVLAASAGVAAAHVTVSSADAAAGGYGKLTFRVPNESDTASTVALRIQIPQEAALASLRAQPVPGWTVTLTQTDLEEPIESHGQEISTYVSVVEFRAEAGGGIGPGEFQEFSLSGGPFPDVDAVAFPTVQTYSDGSEAAWIDPVVEGQDEPEHPTPTLSLTADGSGDGHSDEAAGATDSDTAADDGAGASGTAVTALVIAILGLLAGLGGLALGITARRRTVAR
jgi:uncharacterized protein YcnI